MASIFRSGSRTVKLAEVQGGRVRWLKMAGADAAHGHGPVDFVFIDGDHSEAGLLADWHAWSGLVEKGGVVALHDSRSTPERPIDEAGSVKVTTRVILPDSPLRDGRHGRQSDGAPTSMTSPLRVAVANWSARRVGGIEDYVAAVIAALHQAGTPVAFWHEVDQPSVRARIELPADVPDICAADSGMDAALKALGEWRPDVIYVHGLLDVDAGRRLQQIAPSVLFLHTYTGTCISGGKTQTRPAVVPCDRTFGWPCLMQYFPKGCGGRSPVTMWKEFRRQSTQLEVMRGYKHILTHSDHMKSEMSKHGLRSDIVPFPVATERVTSALQSSASWRLLFVSRLDLLKGGKYLLDALPAIAARAPGRVSLTVAGDGPERDALEARARELDSDAIQTRFTGWISHEHLGTLFQEVDLLVVPSVWPEPFGSVGPLAAQHGVPAAAYDVGGIRAWLTDGEGGHLAPAAPPTTHGLADAVLRCLADPQHHAELRRGARASACRFTMANHLPALMASLEHAARQ